MRRLWCVAVAAALAVPLVGQAAPRASRDAIEGWLAVDFSGTAPRVLYGAATWIIAALGAALTLGMIVIAIFGYTHGRRLVGSLAVEQLPGA